MRAFSSSWRSIRRRTVPILLALIGALFLASACVGGEKAATPSTSQQVTIKIADNTFETNWIENAIVKFIVEKGYGHKVEEVVLTTPGVQAALQTGDTDLAIEFWPGNMQDWWDEQIAKGSIVNFGGIYGGGDQFWVIPKWVSDQYNVKSIEDMKRPEVVQLFKDPEDPNKGVFYNCIIGWQCAEVNRAKFQTYGLDQYYNIVSPGASAALDVALVGAMKKNRPVFGYYWSPTSIYGAYDWYIIEEPPYTEECWADVLKGRDDMNYTPKQACAYDTQSTLKVAPKRFAQEGPPELLEFFRKINVGTKPVSETAAWAVENDIQGDWEKAAIHYLKTYDELWKTWMPGENYNKVKAALEKAGT